MFRSRRLRGTSPSYRRASGPLRRFTISNYNDYADLLRGELSFLPARRGRSASQGVVVSFQVGRYPIVQSRFRSSPDFPSTRFTVHKLVVLTSFLKYSYCYLLLPVSHSFNNVRCRKVVVSSDVCDCFRRKCFVDISGVN